MSATGGSVSLATESEQSAGQGYPTSWALRTYGIPVSLSMDTSVWWSGDLFSAMRTTLGADRSREHFEAHLKGETVTHAALRAEHVVEWATRGGAHALGRDDLGSLEVGKAADLCALDAGRIGMTPCYNAALSVVNYAGQEHVSDVWIAGLLRFADRRQLGVSEIELIKLAALWQNQICPRNV